MAVQVRLQNKSFFTSDFIVTPSLAFLMMSHCTRWNYELGGVMLSYTNLHVQSSEVPSHTALS